MLDGPQRIETGFVSNAGNIDLFVKNFSIRLCRARCNRLAAFFRFVAVKKTTPLPLVTTQISYSYQLIKLLDSFAHTI